jgi:hypothetical protein
MHSADLLAAVAASTHKGVSVHGSLCVMKTHSEVNPTGSQVIYLLAAHTTIMLREGGPKRSGIWREDSNHNTP